MTDKTIGRDGWLVMIEDGQGNPVETVGMAKRAMAELGLSDSTDPDPEEEDPVAGLWMVTLPQWAADRLAQTGNLRVETGQWTLEAEADPDYIE